jgi:glycosyltransferase involved in cell wall biosynthesis
MRSGLKKGLVTSIPRPIRFRLFPYLNGVTRFLAWARKTDIRIVPVELRPRDCLFVPGSFWLDGYASRLAARARVKGAAVVAFVHDVLLVSNPEWLPSRHSQQFRRGVETFLPRCTAIACNSAYTRDEVKKHVPGLNVPITVCRLADSLPAPATMHFPEAIATLAGQRYALLVSTLTPRKNHRLAVAAWQKLWNMLGSDTPWLVCVGGGAPDPALAELLHQSTSYGDRIVRLTDVDDVTLEALYANAWMTVYPSLGEGYGLPVAEALARGKVCLATEGGGIAEVAPGLVDSISATNPEELAKRVSYYVENPARMAAREELIRKHYRCTRWEETAQAVLRVLEDAIARAGGAQRPGPFVEGRY